MTFELNKEDLRKMNKVYFDIRFKPFILLFIVFLIGLYVDFTVGLDSGFKSHIEHYVFDLCMLLYFIIMIILFVIRNIIISKKILASISENEVIKYSIVLENDVYRFENLNIGDGRIFKKETIKKTIYSRNFIFLSILDYVIALPNNDEIKSLFK